MKEHISKPKPQTENNACQTFLLINKTTMKAGAHLMTYEMIVMFQDTS